MMKMYLKAGKYLKILIVVSVTHRNYKPEIFLLLLYQTKYFFLSAIFYCMIWELLLNDGYTEGTALTAEWRTPPLCGLGLSKNSQGGQYFYCMRAGPEVLNKLSCCMAEKPNKAKTILKIFRRSIRLIS